MIGLALALAVLAGPLLRAASWAALVGVLIGLTLGWGLRAVSPPRGGYVLIAAAVGAAFLAFVSPSAAVGPLARWFSPSDGLFYWNPVLWLGLVGSFVPVARASAGAALWIAIAYALVPAGSATGLALAAAAVASLVPALTAVLDAVRLSAARVPLAWIAAGTSVLVVWNFLFMEQYRRNLIPRDDTVSFAEVTRTNAVLFESAFGDPGTWPAGWWFAARHHVSPGRYAAVAARSWMLEAAETETLDLRTSVAPLLVPLRHPLAVDLSVEASGSGALDVVVNGQPAATIPLSPEGGEARVRVAHSFWHRGINEVDLVPSSPGAAALQRLTLRRVGGPW